MKSNRAFTMAELMVVILVVGILAAAAMPLMSGRIESSKWSEAKATMDTIAVALRAYAAEKGTFTSAPSLATIGITESELDGVYFSHEAYGIASASAANGQASFVIICAAANSTRSGKPTYPAVMALTCNAANNYTATFAEKSGRSGTPTARR